MLLQASDPLTEMLALALERSSAVFETSWCITNVVGLQVYYGQYWCYRNYTVKKNGERRYTTERDDNDGTNI